MVLENVKEMWTEMPKTGKGKKKAKPVAKDRFLSFRKENRVSEKLNLLVKRVLKFFAIICSIA